MTDERIDIVVTDKVSSGPAKKLREIASEALKADNAVDRLKASIADVDATALTRLANASSKLTNAQAREVSATARLEQARAKMLAETNKAAISSQRLASEQARTEAATERAAVAATRARTALIAEEAASTRLAAAKRREAAAQNVATTASTRAATASRAASRGARQQAARTQNLIFQVQDIAIGLQAGQKPLTILLQQGTQIAGAFGPGTGVIGILRGVVQATYAMLAPFLPIIAAVGVLTAGFGILTNEVGKTTDVAVGFGDVVKASFILASQAVYDFIQPAITFLQPLFTRVYNFIITATKRTTNNIVGAFVFGKDAIIIAWNLLPAAIGSVVVSATNTTISLVEDMVNGAIGLLNKLVVQANKVGELVGITIATLEDVSIARVENTYDSAGQRLGTALADAANQAFSRDYAGDAFTAIRNKAIDIARNRIAKEAEEEGKSVKTRKAANKELTTKQKLLQDILKPLTDYRTQSAALNELLAEGVISLGQYNQALSSLSLVYSLRDLDTGLVGTPFADQAELDEVRIAEQERLNIVQQALEARIISEQEAADRIVAINSQASQDIQDIETARQSIILTSASDTFASLADAAKGFAGEQSGIYKALFITSKAFAIADSIIKIQQGIANAISLPFPANLAAVGVVAASAANIVSSIQAVQFADGGKVSGPGGPRDDSIIARVSNGEYVVNAAATSRNLPLLEAINSGRDQLRYTSAFRDGGEVQQAFRASAASPRVGNAPQSHPNNVNVNVQVFTRDPDTRIQMTQTQRDGDLARRTSRAQRVL